MLGYGKTGNVSIGELNSKMGADRGVSRWYGWNESEGVVSS